MIEQRKTIEEEPEPEPEKEDNILQSFSVQPPKVQIDRSRKSLPGFAFSTEDIEELERLQDAQSTS